MKRLFSIRGAVCSENTKEDIIKNVGNLARELFRKNSIQAQDLVNIQFTMTPDLNEMNAAAALRKSDTGVDVSGTALFTSQEAVIKGMPQKVVRMMVTVYLEESAVPCHVYQNGAEKLRPDLCGAGR